MRARRAGLLCALAAAAVIATSCSTAPRQADSVSTMKRQAAQDAAYGDSYYRQGKYALATQFLTLALNEYTSVDDVQGVISVYNALGKAAMATGDLDAAEALLLKARENAKGVSEPLLFVTTINLGELYLAKKDAQQAFMTLSYAQGMALKTRTRAQTAVLFHDLGTAAKNLGNSAKALEFYGKSLEINLSQKLFAEAASDYYMMASVHSVEGRGGEALELGRKALELDKQVENSPGIAADLYALGLIAAKAGDVAAAFDWFQRSYLVYTTLGFMAERKKALVQLAAAAESLGRTAELETYRSALAELGGP
jgi:tetratricopeptide (TPR) repeat protein